jgi:hypothetical protein
VADLEPSNSRHSTASKHTAQVVRQEFFEHFISCSTWTAAAWN